MRKLFKLTFLLILFQDCSNGVENTNNLDAKNAEVINIVEHDREDSSELSTFFVVIDGVEYDVFSAYEFVLRSNRKVKYIDAEEYAWHCQEDKNLETYHYDGITFHVNELTEVSWLYLMDMSASDASLILDGYKTDSSTNEVDFKIRFKDDIKDVGRKLKTFEMSILEGFSVYFVFEKGKLLTFYNARRCLPEYWLPVKSGQSYGIF